MPFEFGWEFRGGDRRVFSLYMASV